MKTLIVNKDGTLEVIEIDKPSYHAKQALVKTIACGICNGTDAKLIHRTFKGVEPEDYPVMLGHEAVGEVVEVGSEVTGYKIGDRVLLPFVDPEEKYGTLGSAWGGFSEYAVVNDAGAFGGNGVPECAYAQTIVPDYVDSVDSVVIITLREVLSSIKRFGIKENNSAAVFGGGPVGLTFIRFMSILGVHPIIAFVKKDKIEEAYAKGADYVFDSFACNPKEEIKKICPDGVQFVVDAVGLNSLIGDAMEYICDAGKICCYGISKDCSMQLDWSKAPYNWQIQFQQFPSKAEEGEANAQILSWIRLGIIDLKEFISDYFSFEQVIEAFDKLEKREIKKKAIVTF